jgi:hypothetical protein
MSAWYIIWFMNLALLFWNLFMRLRRCECEDLATYRTCTRVHWRSCYVKYYETHHYGEGVMRIGKTSEEHVWANDEFLVLFDPC